MIIKFKIVSFRETDRIQKSTPMFLTNKGIKTGKEHTEKVWDYELTDEKGNVWNAGGTHKRGGFRKGQIIMTTTQGFNGQRIGKLLTPTEFLEMISKRIDREKECIEVAQKEIERLRAL